MKLGRSTAEIFIPDGAPVSKALARTTCLCIAAHADDIEIMAPSFILEAYGRRDKWFTGVVVTNGAGSPRAGSYAKYTDREMQAVRREEQKRAASLGEFSAVVLLDHPSAAVKDPRRSDVRRDIANLVRAAKPDVVVTHNLADKHDTHIALALRVVEALRALPPSLRPKKLYGGEVWRDLDWMLDADKVQWDVSGGENLQAALIGAFDSQISGGKRYDLAIAGRRRAHATYNQSHHVDATTSLSLGMDMTALLRNPTLQPGAFVERFIERFGEDVADRILRFQ